MKSRDNIAKLQNANVPIVIFGASENGESFVDFLFENNIMPAAFCDNFIKGAKEIGDIKISVISFQGLMEQYKDAYVLIGALFSAEQVKADLLHAGFDADKILYFTDVWSPFDEECDMRDESVETFTKPEAVRDGGDRHYANMRKALLVAYYFPPLAGSGVYRPLKFAKYLPSLGWDTTVVSAAAPQKGWEYRDDSLLAELPEEVHVFRVADALQNGVFSIFRVPRWKIENAMAFLRVLLNDEEKRFLNVHFKDLHQWIHLFSEQLLWAYEVCAKLEEKQLLDYEVVYTTSAPYFSHLVGLYLHKKYHIPWVADFRDEWTYNPYKDYDIENNPYHRLSFFLEKKIVHATNCVLCISGLMKASYIMNFGLDPEKLKVITNGYDEDDFIKLGWQNKKNEKFTIVYSGLVYLKERNLLPLFAALSHSIKTKLIKSECVEFKFFGDTAGPTDFLGQVEDYDLENVVEVNGYVTHSEAIKGCLKANILACLIGDEVRFNGVYTGKIFDYLRCGKPILAIAPHGGVVDQLLQETGHGIAVTSEEIEKIEAFICAAYQKWEKDEPIEYHQDNAIGMYERKYLTKQLAEVFEEVRRSAHL